MTVCEKCWWDAGGDPDRYREIVADRESHGEPCSPEQQCGEMHLVVQWTDGRADQCRCGKVVKNR